MNRLWRILPVVLALGLVVGLPLVGRADRWGGIGGVVRYSSGDVARDAAVTITEESTGRSILVRSDQTGSFFASGIAEGVYSIRVRVSGHIEFSRSGISVAEGHIYRQDAVLARAGEPVNALTGGPQVANPLSGARGTENQQILDCRSEIQDHPVECANAVADESQFGDALAVGPVGPSAHPHEPLAESVTEMDPVGTAYRWQAGPSSGFQLHTGRDGTNEFHGALYYFLGNDVLNARGFFGSKSKDRANNLAAYVGGPIVKNKTFFTYQYDRLAVRAGAQSGFGNSSPTAAFRRGEFARLMSGRAIAADALGRQSFEGQVFDPASTRTIRGVPVRDPFANNTIPAAHPMRSRVSASVTSLMVDPQQPGLEFNVQGIPSGEQIWEVNAPSHHGRVDHAFTATFRTGFMFSRTSHPAVRNCGGVDGCRVTHDPVESPQLNTRYYGTGFYEDVTTHHVRQKFDWIVSPNVFNQFTVGYDEFHVTGHALSAGAGWQERLWGQGGNGLLASDAGPPALSFTGNTRYSPLGNERGRSGFLANHQYRIANDFTWFRGRHAFKVSGEVRHHNYPFRGWANNVAGSFNFHRGHTAGFDADGNNLPATGDPFASFLLGQVNSTHFQIPDFPTITENFLMWSAVDEIRVTSEFTLTVGLRFDYQSSIRERNDNMSTFDPNVPNPGAGGRLGAMIFAGTGPGRTGARTLEAPPRDAFGPRVGFAYRLGDRSVVRGAYGIYYSAVPHAHFDSVNTLGFRFHATAIDLSNGHRPAYFLDDGFPKANIVLPPSIDPAVGNNTSPVAVTRDRATLPRVQQWSLTVQRQVTRNTAVDLSYEGNRGSRLITDRRVLGPAANANVPDILRLGPSVLAARAESEFAGSAGVPMPYRGFGRTVAQSLRPFPHMLNIGYMNVPAGNSFFHALRTRVEKRFSDGAHLQATYLWSKLTGMGAGRMRSIDGLGHGPQNPADTHSLERGLSLDDMPHRVLASFTHAVPFFRGRKVGLAAKMFGGWSVSGLVRVETGTPVNVVMANDLEPFLFNGQKRPNVLTDQVRIDHRGVFDAAADTFFDHGAFSDPGPLRFGNASRTMGFVRGFHNVAEDFSLFKDTWINQKFKIRFETQFANPFNRVVFCDPNRNWSAASFGRVYAQCNSPRSVQFGLRMDF